MRMMRGQREARNFKRSLQDSLFPISMGKYRNCICKSILLELLYQFLSIFDLISLSHFLSTEKLEKSLWRLRLNYQVRLLKKSTGLNSDYVDQKNWDVLIWTLTCCITSEN